jgi:hypothetical protein
MAAFPDDDPVAAGPDAADRPRARPGRRSGRREDYRLDHIRGAVAWHPVLWFVVLEYALAWVCWLPLLADRQDWLRWSVSPYLHLAGALGPAVAAVIVTAAVSGREGLRVLLRRTLAWPAWLVDGARPDLGRFGASTEYPGLPLVGYWLASLVFYGYGEEIGWRGLLQPALQRRRSALGAITVVSLATIPALLKARPATHHRGPVAVAPSSTGVTP